VAAFRAGQDDLTAGQRVRRGEEDRRPRISGRGAPALRALARGGPALCLLAGGCPALCLLAGDRPALCLLAGGRWLVSAR